MTSAHHPVIMLRNISDDDVCSDCTYCTRGGNGHTCALGWPGAIDPDGYVVECPQHRADTQAENVGYLHQRPFRVEGVHVRNLHGDVWQAWFEGAWRKVHIQVNRTFIICRGERITIQIEGV